MALYRKIVPKGCMPMDVAPPIHRGLHVYDSTLCVSCIVFMDGRHKGDGFTPQIVPVNPEIYASYLCTSCFIDLPIAEVYKLFRSYLLSEEGLLEEQQKAWGAGILFHDPFRYLEHAIGFLRGLRREPPFKCSVFALHKKHFLKIPESGIVDILPSSHLIERGYFL